MLLWNVWVSFCTAPSEINAIESYYHNYHINCAESCPYDVAFADKAQDTDRAHKGSECSRNGLCDRNSVRLDQYRLVSADYVTQWCGSTFYVIICYRWSAIIIIYAYLSNAWRLTSPKYVVLDLIFYLILLRESVSASQAMLDKHVRNVSVGTVLLISECDAIWFKATGSLQSRLCVYSYPFFHWHFVKFRSWKLLITFSLFSTD